jgi:hypothetical protein
MRNFYAILSLLLILGLTTAKAQEGIEGEPGTAVLINKVNFSQIEGDMLPFLGNVSIVHNHENVDNDEAIIEEKRRINEAFLERMQNEPPAPASRGEATNPVKLNDFRANPYNGFIPNDNSIAVSSDYIVSVSNTRIVMYDINGQELQRNTLEQFAQPADTVGGAFDPHALYDKDNDRFIVLYANGALNIGGHDDGFSNVIVPFSESGNPTQGWNTYALNGNVSPDTTWLDYPQLAITNEELFISGNLFNLAGRSVGNIIWQINLNDGYSGENTLALESYQFDVDGFITPLAISFSFLPSF